MLATHSHTNAQIPRDKSIELEAIFKAFNLPQQSWSNGTQFEIPSIDFESSRIQSNLNDCIDVCVFVCACVRAYCVVWWYVVRVHIT